MPSKDRQFDSKFTKWDGFGVIATNVIGHGTVQ